MKIDPHFQRQSLMPNDSSFWQYKAYVDIWVFPGDGASNDCGVIESMNF